MSYCVYSDVGLLLSLTFDTSSIPTAVKVGEIIDLISSEVNMVLRGAGVNPPTDITSDLYKVVKLKVMQGSAAIIGLSYYGNKDGVEAGQAAYYQKMYSEFIIMVKTDSSFASSLSSETRSFGLENHFTQGEIAEVDLDRIMLPDEMPA